LLAWRAGSDYTSEKTRRLQQNDDFTTAVLNAPPDITRLMCRVIITWFCQLTGEREREEIDGVFFGVANSKVDADGWLLKRH
jgi:hypothetical protein